MVVGAYHVHGDPRAALSGLPVLGGTRNSEADRALDVEAVLARNPDVVCIDDLTGPDTDGAPRIEAVPRFLRAGITVLATLHVLSVKGVAESLSGIVGPESGPLVDASFLSLVNELEIVDIPPEDLLARIRELGILRPAQLAAALQRRLRPSVLAALRETALRMVADHVDRQFVEELRQSAGGAPPEIRGRIVLCLDARPGMEGRIRAAAQYAHTQDATFTVVTVRRSPLSPEKKTLLGEYAALTHQLGGDFQRLEDRNVAAGLARFIKSSYATEVILGHRRSARWGPLHTTHELIRLLDGVDIHILRSDPDRGDAGQSGSGS